MPDGKIDSRRDALGALASLPALALAAVPAAAFALTAAVDIADPIHAAIERHKQALAAFTEAIKRTDGVAARNEGREVTETEEAAEEATSATEQEAVGALLDTQPTTTKGLRALVSYVLEIERDLLSEDTPAYRCLEAILNSPLLAA